MCNMRGNSVALLCKIDEEQSIDLHHTLMYMYTYIEYIISHLTVSLIG